MKRLLLGLVFAGLFAGAASAADMRMPRKAPPPVAAPAAIWSGFYLGAMGGYATDNSDDFNGIDISAKGGFAGGTVGYNWQFGQWVLGLEGDAAWTGIKADANALGVFVEDRVRAWGTVRGRVGVAFDTVLLYATGGYAWMDNRIRIAVPALLVNISDSNYHHGWTAGAGVEWMFAPKWSFKAEYLYREFGSESYFGAPLFPGGIATGSIGFHSGQVGVNFHF
jgi:outer membrane immunogenic protein